MRSPPGLVYILQCLPGLVVPPGLLYIFTAVLRTYLWISFPTWVITLACVLSPLISVVLNILYQDYTAQRAATANDAVLPPRVKDTSFGGIKLLSVIIDDFKNGYPGEVFDEWSQVYGNTFNIRVLFKNRIYTKEPELIKAVLATQFDSFEKGPKVRERMACLLGTGVFNSDGDMWKFHRSMTRPFFSKDRVTDFEIFGRHADDAIDQLKARLGEGYPVDFQDLVARFTLDSATEFLFGRDVCSLSAGLPYPYTADPSLSPPPHPANGFVHAFSETQHLISLRERFGDHWRLREFWADQVQEHIDVIDNFIKPLVDEAVANKQAMRQTTGKLAGAGDEETLLSHLVNFTEDRAVLRDEILNIVVAGRDTTAATLTFAIYLLAEHPAVLLRLRREILDSVGNSRYPTYDDLRDMKYLRAVINETLRLYPAVGFNVRLSNQEVIIPSKTPGGKPFYLPPGTRVVFSVFLMHRRTDLWGPDALQFDPDRFIDERLHKYLTRNPFIFLPFSAGPRICLGQQFAYNEVSFFLIRLLQSISSIQLAPDAQPPSSRPPVSWAKASGSKATTKFWPKTHLTMYSLGGLWVRMGKPTPVEAEQCPDIC